MKLNEEAFETEIVASLVIHGGYEEGHYNEFDREIGLAFSTTLEFIRETQLEQWDRLVKLHGGPNEAQQAFRQRLAKELDARGTVDVLRQGVVDHGVTIKLAYFRPAHSLTPALVQRYDKNMLSVIRQLRYEQSSDRSVDLA